jgi:hypothetical protein
VNVQHALLHRIVDQRREPEREAQVLVHQRKQRPKQPLQRRAIARHRAPRELPQLSDRIRLAVGVDNRQRRLTSFRRLWH